MSKEPKVSLGETVKIGLGAERQRLTGLVYGITSYLDGSYGYCVMTSNYDGTARHTLTEYEVHKLDKKEED